MSDYLAKPVTIDDLEEKIELWSKKTHNKNIEPNNETANTHLPSENKYIWDKSNALQRFRNNEDRFNKIMSLFRSESLKDIQTIRACDKSIDFIMKFFSFF
mgnify:CR=1 FL=1